MSTKYKFSGNDYPYFITATTVEWVDVFTRNLYNDILVDSFRYCQIHQGLRIHAWIIMTNHFHMICSFKQCNSPGLIIKNIKSFTSRMIIARITNNPHESRKTWLLDIFQKHGNRYKSNYKYKFWQRDNHPIILDTPIKLQQRMDYLHNNPVRAGFVLSPEDWAYGSGIDYYSQNRKGLLELEYL